MIALLKGHVKIVRLLFLEEGADPTLCACVGYYKDYHTTAEEDVTRTANKDKKDKMKAMIAIALKYHTYTNDNHAQCNGERVFNLPNNMIEMLQELRKLPQHQHQLSMKLKLLILVLTMPTMKNKLPKANGVIISGRCTWYYNSKHSLQPQQLLKFVIALLYNLTGFLS
jgi:hypothetical protein